MDSTKLLSTYLLERSSLEDIVSLEKFIKLFPKSADKDTIESIYSQLCQQKEQQLMQIEKSIEDEFDTPIDHDQLSEEIESKTLGTLTVDMLVKKLLSLSELLEAEMVKTNTSNDLKLNEIKQTVTKLNDLKCSDSRIDVSLKSTVESLLQMEKFLLREQ